MLHSNGCESWTKCCSLILRSNVALQCITSSDKTQFSPNLHLKCTQHRPNINSTYPNSGSKWLNVNSKYKMYFWDQIDPKKVVVSMWHFVTPWLCSCESDNDHVTNNPFDMFVSKWSSVRYFKLKNHLKIIPFWIL